MLRRRIGEFLSYPEQQIYLLIREVADIRFIKSEENYRGRINLSTLEWKPFGSGGTWGGHREYYQFDLKVAVPECFEGKYVYPEVLVGKERGWNTASPQFSRYVDGVLRQGLDANHREVVLSEYATPGQEYRIVPSALTGDQNLSLKLRTPLKVLDRLIGRYYCDISVLYHTTYLLSEEDRDYITIISIVNQFVSLLGLRKEGPLEYYESLVRAQQYIIEGLCEERYDTKNRPTICCIGHTHVGCVWLWTLRVAQDKAVRSFSTVLELMRQYPKYRFMSGQLLLCQFAKKNAPGIYEEIRGRVRGGRWETEGAMLAEADRSLSSGESPVRQTLYDKRFFREEFGKNNVVVWLPDVFGYSVTLPQTMKKTGIRYLTTTKINWDEFNRVPYDAFMWRGIDGTEILTHFIPIRGYKNTADSANRTSLFATYNGFINPFQAKGSWRRYNQKYLNQETPMVYGYRDGDGGTTKKMPENQRRLSKGISNYPNARIPRVTELFEKPGQDVCQSPYLPVWSGELYLKYHKNTYTAAIRNKRYNRRSGFACQNMEWLGVVEGCLLGEGGLSGGGHPGEKHPTRLLKENWEIMVKNQFHNILPGSSIKEIYEDSKAEYEGLLERAGWQIREQLQGLADHVDTRTRNVVMFNLYGTLREGVTEFSLGKEKEVTGSRDGLGKISIQQTTGGRYIFKTLGVPSKGYHVYGYGEENTMLSELIVNEGGMENRYFILGFNEKGQFSHIYDKENEHEILESGRADNVIVNHGSYPYNYDVWNINNYYAEKGWEVDRVSSVQTTGMGPVCTAVQVDRQYLDLAISQTIYLCGHTPKTDIRTKVDWSEYLIMLKDMFSLGAHTDEASFRIRYGNVKRPTHSNASWDFAKLEVCVHKWLDMSEYGHGASLFNNCKYGCSVEDEVVGLIVLKSPPYPNPDVDREKYRFWYSIYPHKGDWREAGTVKQAYLFNDPLMAAVKNGSDRTLPLQYSLVFVDTGNIVIEVVKQAKDSRDAILRIYECSNQRTDTCFTRRLSVKGAAECDVLEVEKKTPDAAKEGTRLSFMPFKIKAVKLMLQSPQRAGENAQIQYEE